MSGIDKLEYDQLCDLRGQILHPSPPNKKKKKNSSGYNGYEMYVLQMRVAMFLNTRLEYFISHHCSYSGFSFH